MAAVARATREAATTLEETRRMYEERVEASQADRDARVKAAEERASAAQHERQRAEAARQAASKELARLQVTRDAAACGAQANYKPPFRPPPNFMGLL